MDCPSLQPRWVALGRKREIPRSKRRFWRKAGTGTDRTQIRQIQMRFPSEIKSLLSEQERKQEMQRREGCRWEQQKIIGWIFLAPQGDML
jgi:hypothetical protein